jgi:triacylglycerol esterase/lipase EstA (alpha/beta hydrolase family)
MPLTQRLYVLAVTLILLGVILTGCNGTPSSASTPKSTSQSLQDARKDPVLFIHGIAPLGSGSFNCLNFWGDANQVLQSSSYPVLGQTGRWNYEKLITLGYYTGDYNCDVELGHDNTSDKYPLADYNTATLQDVRQHCGLTDYTKLTKQDMPIEVVSCMVAWYIYDAYTLKGINVRVVAHSMGGLIIRYAMYASNYRLSIKRTIRDALANAYPVNLSFPGPLRISNVVTIDTPHGGLNFGAAFTCVSPCIERDEMTSGSDFMNSLFNHAQSPQGQGGTKWMLMGSACAFLGCSLTDSISAFTNSRYMNGAWLKVWYTCGPICYSHGSFLTDSNQNWDTNVKFCTYCKAGDDGPNDTHNMPRSLYMMKYGLLGIDPRHDPYKGLLTLNPTPTPTPTATPSPTATSIAPINFQQPVPDCNNPPGTTWTLSQPSALPLSCNASPIGGIAPSLLLQPTASDPATELDLVNINGTPYDLSNQYSVSVTVGNNSGENIWAGLLVQTPRSSTACGGYLFEINDWQWRLRSIDSCTSAHNIVSGTCPELRCGSGAVAFTLTVEVVDASGVEQLIPSLDGSKLFQGNEIVSILDTLPTDGMVSLFVRSYQSTSVPIGFYNFALNTTPCANTPTSPCPLFP